MQVTRVNGDSRNSVGYSFWAGSYVVSAVKRDEAVIRTCVGCQEQEGHRSEQMNPWRIRATSVAYQFRGRVSCPDRSFERRQP